MTNLAKQRTKSLQSIDIDTINEYDITKDEIFNRFSNSKLPDGLEEPSSGIIQYAGAFGKNEAAHLLRRTVFGHDKATLDAYSTKTVTQAVDDILNTTTAVSEYPKYWNNAASSDYGQEWHNQGYIPIKDNEQSTSLAYWLAGRITGHDSTIMEKMVFFWHNHFATEIDAVGNSIDSYNYFKLIRDNAMGNFKDFAYKMTIEPAMLKYLNGIYNTKNAPDENHARELMELFTLGKDPASQYTESDVQLAAKVLTGWKINGTTRASFFNAAAHDSTNKTFSSFFNGNTINGKTGATGALEVQDLIDLIFTKSDVVAQFIVRKLYRYFVYYNITADIETNVIIPLANDFKANWDIKPLLKALLVSDHFYDPLNRGCYIKTPFDLFGGMNRAFKLISPSSTIFKQYKSYELTYFFGATMSLLMGEPPNVAGWPAFYQTPKYHEIWINSDTFPKRVSYLVYVGYTGYRIQNEAVVVDHIAMAEQFGTDAADPDKLVAGICDLALGLDISAASKTTIKVGSLLGGLTVNSYWTTAWNDYQADKNNAVKKNTVVLRLVLLLKFIFELPEYQLM